MERFTSLILFQSTLLYVFMSSGGDRNDFPFLFFLLIHYRHNLMGRKGRVGTRSNWSGLVGSGRVDGWKDGRRDEEWRTYVFLSFLSSDARGRLDGRVLSIVSYWRLLLLFTVFLYFIVQFTVLFYTEFATTGSLCSSHGIIFSVFSILDRRRVIYIHNWRVKTFFIIASLCILTRTYSW